MAVTANERLSMVEVSKRLHRGVILPEVELLAQDNGGAEDALWQKANNGFSHIYSQVTSMPTVSKSAFNEGQSASKSTSAQETETTTMLAGLSEVDADMIEANGEEGPIRAREDARFAEVMKQEFAKLLIYGNRATNARDFDGLAVRYGTLTGNKAKNVFSCGGQTANVQTSIYGAVWGSGLYGIYPEGTTAGYKSENLGKYPKVLSTGKTLIVKGTKHKWHVGLVQEDWRCGGRICNIEVSHAKALTNNQAPGSYENILHKLVLLKQRLDRVSGKKALLVNDTVGALLMRICLEKSSPALSLMTAMTQLGKQTTQLHWFDIPIRRVDQILDTEAVVA